MSVWFMYGAFSIAFLLVATVLFFFTVTHGALILRRVRGATGDDAAHIYPVYTNMRLIRLVDFQPVIAAILLFQYDRLVAFITAELRHTDLRDKKVLITSCAFGNVIPEVVAAAVDAGAATVVIADLIQNELDHAEGKLAACAGKLRFLRDNATAMSLPDGSVAANVIFFLLHELPHPLKVHALSEACRVLEPGGKLYLAEFHRPDPWLLRTLSWTYFKVFEPLGLALWDSHDPVRQLEATGEFRCERRTVFFGNFQIIVATRASGATVD